MITSKQILKISEDYYTAKNIAGSYTIVYMNPNATDKKELYSALNNMNAAKRIRAIADTSKQKVYVWDAYNAHHAHMRPVLGYNVDTISDYRVIDIYATFSGPQKLMFEDWECNRG